MVYAVYRTNEKPVDMSHALVHVNFMDEVASAMRLVDGIVLVVDVVEGVSS